MTREEIIMSHRDNDYTKDLIDFYVDKECGKIVVGDPCYNVNNRWNHILNAMEGEWTSYLYYVGDSYEFLHAHTLDMDPPNKGDVQEEWTLIAVDSGSVGVLNYNNYKDEHSDDVEWIDFLRELIDEQPEDTSNLYGIIQTAPHGDGLYDVLIERYKGKVFSVRIFF
ncbi:hypothetical protein ACJEBK_28305 [Peribacillus frigoritolerans]|uniref:hypothetical protein n=1 Tax=Peribacillus frigoritolerans TaxID=450367 RepID=UPI0038726CC1